MARVLDMGKSSGYVLLLEGERRKQFLYAAEEVHYFAEPVPDFKHSKGLPLLCIISCEKGFITHFGASSKGRRAGTNLTRLNVNVLDGEYRIEFDKVMSRVAPRVRKYVAECLESGGVLPEQSFLEFVDAIIGVDSRASAVLSRFGSDRVRRLAKISREARHALGYQKEAVCAALKISGIDMEQVQHWTPKDDDVPSSFLDGMPQTRHREDAMIFNDMRNIPGFEYVRSATYDASIFKNDTTALTVIIANRQALESQTGADLIYYNEKFRSFVMVQYKALEDDCDCFRMPDKDLDRELTQMRRLGELLGAVPLDRSVQGCRLSSVPFYLKFCPRIVFNPDDVSLSVGMYIPLHLFDALCDDDCTKGPRGGKNISYKNVGRYITNTEFISLVAGAWIGTTGTQSELLGEAVRSVLSGERALVLALRSSLDKLPFSK